MTLPLIYTDLCLKQVFENPTLIATSTLGCEYRALLAAESAAGQSRVARFAFKRKRYPGISTHHQPSLVGTNVLTFAYSTRGSQEWVYEN
jgi:hypothetical protein